MFSYILCGSTNDGWEKVSTINNDECTIVRIQLKNPEREDNLGDLSHILVLAEINGIKYKFESYVDRCPPAVIAGWHYDVPENYEVVMWSHPLVSGMKDRIEAITVDVDTLSDEYAVLL